MKNWLYLIILLLATNQAWASLICPDNVTINCDTDISQTNITGTPILFNTPSEVLNYQDIANTNSCGLGTVVRKWYADYNGNGQPDQGEPTCTHNITIIDIAIPTVINFPKDITVSCKASIPSSDITWTAGPCDLIGHSFEDQVFNISSDACYKIRRRYKVVNWCDYQPQDPNWNGEGYWEHDQYIKVVDKEGPILEACSDTYFGLDNECQATVSLSKSAEDLGDCPSQELEWHVEIDLWADGTLDHIYSPSQTGIFQLDKTKNKEEVIINIPDKLKAGKHKVKWNVKDPCGNWSSCLEYFYTEDQKAPTPYCYQVIYAAFDGDDGQQLHVPASLFNAGSFDNCTEQEKITYSFSGDPLDDTLVIECVTSGIQFLNIYATDKSGNQEFCNAFMVIFDNDQCGFRFTPMATIVDAAGKTISDAHIIITFDDQKQERVFTHNANNVIVMNDLPLYDDMAVIPVKIGLSHEIIDIEDYQLLTNFLLNKEAIQPLSLVAADLDGIPGITPSDLRELRDYLLRKKSSFRNPDWQFVTGYDPMILNKSLKAFPLQQVFTGVPMQFHGVMSGDINMSSISTEGRTSPTLFINSIQEELGTKIALSELEYQAIQMAIRPANEALVANFTNLLQPSEWHLEDETIYLLTNQASTLQDLFFEEGIKPDITGKLIDKEGQVFKLKLKDYGYNNNQYVIYPNPSSSYIHISGPPAIAINICDIHGRIQSLDASAKTIDVSHLVSGIYLLQIQHEEGTDLMRFVVEK